MDRKTEAAYAQNAESYSQDWLSQPTPSDMYELLQKHFVPGGRTADVGCGNGRDAAWLKKNGYDVIGYDASSELVAIASQLYPHIPFATAKLPELTEIEDSFTNILCETVIMHLAVSEIEPSLDRIRRLVRKGGVLYLSWRVSEGEDTRHSDGRLYSAFLPSLVTDFFAKDTTLHFEDVTSQSSGKRVCRLIVRIT